MKLRSSIDLSEWCSFYYIIQGRRWQLSYSVVGNAKAVIVNILHILLHMHRLKSAEATFQNTQVIIGQYEILDVAIDCSARQPHTLIAMDIF